MATGPNPGPVRRDEAREAGLTLIEVAVTLALLAVVTALALPTWHHWLARQELANRAQTLATALERARTEAIKRGHRVNLCKSTDASTCADDGEWTRGWIVHADPGSEGRPLDGEPPIAWDPPAVASITVGGNRPVEDYVSFTPLGEPRRLSGALQMGTFRVCRPGQDALEVVLAATGRVRTVRTRDRCP
ncbi:hypothetical protein BURK1_03524 [Burkholderiales bacterium]|nr:hypothetical protein BURK1_03524 [Burkholderiales bacterium]